MPEDQLFGSEFDDYGSAYALPSSSNSEPRPRRGASGRGVGVKRPTVGAPYAPTTSAQQREGRKTIVVLNKTRTCFLPSLCCALVVGA